MTFSKKFLALGLLGSLIASGGAYAATQSVAASTGNPNLTLDHFSGFYKGQLISSFPRSTLSLPATSPASTPLYLGGTVAANASLIPGTYHASFLITVFVQ